MARPRYEVAVLTIDPLFGCVSWLIKNSVCSDAVLSIEAAAWKPDHTQTPIYSAGQTGLLAFRRQAGLSVLRRKSFAGHALQGQVLLEAWHCKGGSLIANVLDYLHGMSAKDGSHAQERMRERQDGETRPQKSKT